MPSEEDDRSVLELVPESSWHRAQIGRFELGRNNILYPLGITGDESWMVWDILGVDDLDMTPK